VIKFVNDVFMVIVISNCEFFILYI